MLPTTTNPSQVASRLQLSIGVSALEDQMRQDHSEMAAKFAHLLS